MVSTTMAAAIACITCLWSAGITYHGAQSVDVAVMASLVGLHVLVPVGPLGHVGRVELPLLVGVVEAGDEAPLLLRLGHVEEELHDLRAVAVEVALEALMSS